jgi:hypothetical protein
VSGGGERNIKAIGGIQATSDDVGAPELKAGDRKEALFAEGSSAGMVTFAKSDTRMLSAVTDDRKGRPLRG